MTPPDGNGCPTAVYFTPVLSTMGLAGGVVSDAAGSEVLAKPDRANETGETVW